MLVIERSRNHYKYTVIAKRHPEDQETVLFQAAEPISVKICEIRVLLLSKDWCDRINNNRPFQNIILQRFNPMTKK